MDNTASVLASLFKRAGMEDRFTFACLQREWASLFDGPLALHVCPSSLNKGTLVINVDSPLWMQQLKYFKPAMLRKLESYSITSIELRHGKIRPFGKRQAESDVSGQPGPEKCKKLTDTDAAWIEQTLADVDDPELQQQIRKVLEKALLTRK